MRAASAATAMAMRLAALGALLTLSASAASTERRDDGPAAVKQCLFIGETGYYDAIRAKVSCDVLTLQDMVVPAGQTLDLTGLKTGANVRTSAAPMTLYPRSRASV